MIDHAPMVSIVVPTYNCEKYIEECIQNILDQSYPNLQIIIVDDGSIDNTFQLCSGFTDNRIVLVHKENGGASSARNYGLRYAKGDYILFADSDDYLEKNAVSILVELIEAEEADVVYFEADNFAEDTSIRIKKNGLSQKKDYPILRGNDLIPLLLKNKDYHAAPVLYFIKREVFQSGLHFKEGIMMEDELYTFQLLRFCKKVVCLRKELYHRRVRSDSVMTSKGKEQFRYISIQTVLKELLKERNDGQNDSTLEQYLARVGMLLIGYWDQVPKNERKIFRDQFLSVRRIIRNAKGFGSKELLVRTYGLLPWVIYVLPDRVKKRLRGRF